ncbi:MAG: DNA repair protein RecN [Chloroflexota bacterium]|nr:DNA repair protein RecN [Chloroflexota bacterium]
MLLTLTIRNFAIIDSAEIPFSPGLNVLTGETGAGKSILVDALGSVLGERTSPEMVRTGARGATVDAVFDLSSSQNAQAIAAALADLEVETDNGELILSREILATGRSSARLNGRPTTASVLSQLGALLVDVHGQSDHLSLLKPAAQLDLLDRYARTTELRERFRRVYAELREVRERQASFDRGARERMQRMDLLQYQVEEIREAAPQIDEDVMLIAERSRLANAERLTLDAALVYAQIVGSDTSDDAPTATALLRTASHALQEISELDASVRELSERLNDALFALEDVAAGVRDYRDEIESDPGRLAEVEERLDLLRNLQRKYGGTLADVLAFADDAATELETLTGSEMSVEALAEREAALAAEAGALAAELSAQRQEAGIALAAGVERSIAELHMGRAAFAVQIEQRPDPAGIPVRLAESDATLLAADASGIDHVTFLIAPNAGEGLKPLARIASGGETARLMLALKSILSDVDETPTLVFDEIDVGVGGRSGQVVGEKLAALVESHQVIVITHLAQIAAYAGRHFRIAKAEQDGRVVSTIGQLDQQEREEELAAMLDGLPLTPGALETARTMLERATRTD